PIPGLQVTFTAQGSGASCTFTGGLSTVSANTNSSGVATAPTFTANTVAGTFLVSASVAGVTPGNFTLTNNAGNPASITTTAGSGQNTTVNTAFAATLRATVKDLFNNPVGGRTVTYTAPTTGASGTFTGGLTTTTAQSNSDGIVASPAFTTNSIPG